MCAEAIVEYLESTPAAEIMPIKIDLKKDKKKIKKIYELGADGSQVCCLKEKYRLSTSQEKNNDKDG